MGGQPNISNEIPELNSTYEIAYQIDDTAGDDSGIYVSRVFRLIHTLENMARAISKEIDLGTVHIGWETIEYMIPTLSWDDDMVEWRLGGVGGHTNCK